MGATTSSVTVSPGSTVNALTRSGEITFRYRTAKTGGAGRGTAGRGEATTESVPSANEEYVRRLTNLEACVVPLYG
jgi:hypothetical protein